MGFKEYARKDEILQAARLTAPVVFSIPEQHINLLRFWRTLQRPRAMKETVVPEVTTVRKTKQPVGRAKPAPLGSPVRRTKLRQQNDKQSFIYPPPPLLPNCEDFFDLARTRPQLSHNLTGDMRFVVTAKGEKLAITLLIIAILAATFWFTPPFLRAVGGFLGELWDISTTPQGRGYDPTIGPDIIGFLITRFIQIAVSIPVIVIICAVYGCVFWLTEFLVHSLNWKGDFRSCPKSDTKTQNMTLVDQAEGTTAIGKLTESR